MSEELDFYHQQFELRRSSLPWVLKLQRQGSDDFLHFGFPTRHHEHWKYTDVSSFLKQRFKEEAPTCQISSISKDVLVLPLQEALSLHADKIKPYMNQILHHEHAFHALNTAMLRDGFFIYLPKGVALQEPIYLSYEQPQSEKAIYLRHLVICEEGSSLSLVEEYQGLNDACYFTNTITEVHLARNAILNHYKIQRESPKAFHFGDLVAKQSFGSKLQSHVLSQGGAWVRSDTNLCLQEGEAECLMNGLYLPTGHQHMDHHTLVTHAAPNGKSLQDYKGVLNGQSRAVFNGRVIVAPGAQKTEAKQLNKNLLLSMGAEIDTKPQLEIFADDVVCSHGATVGQLDTDALFYLATRGIPREDAIRYLVRAFMVDNLRYISNEALASKMGSFIHRITS